MEAFGFHTEVVPLTVHVSDIDVRRYDNDGVQPVWHKNIACEHVKADLAKLRRKAKMTREMFGDPPYGRIQYPGGKP
jgi:hypothetical protein